MVNIRLWGTSAEELMPYIEQEHQKAWQYSKFYLLYPVAQRWKLKTKEQHLKSVRTPKGKNFVCKWCTSRSCTKKINNLDEMFAHITEISKRKVTLSMMTENEYRKKRGWEPVVEEMDTGVAEDSSEQPSTSKKTSAKKKKNENETSTVTTEKKNQRASKDKNTPSKTIAKKSIKRNPKVRTETVTSSNQTNQIEVTNHLDSSIHTCGVMEKSGHKLNYIIVNDSLDKRSEIISAIENLANSLPEDSIALRLTVTVSKKIQFLQNNV